MRSGAACVGVSAQLVGVNALKASGPTVRVARAPRRQSLLRHLHARRSTVRDNPTVLGGLTPERLIAAGESQSAGRLVTYVDAIHPLTNVYDGFMVHSRGAGGSALTQAPLPATSVPSPAPIRNDLDVPVMVVQAEGDVIGSTRRPPARHAEVPTVGARRDLARRRVHVDGLDDRHRRRQRCRRRCSTSCATHPMSDAANTINAGPHHWLLQTAYPPRSTPGCVPDRVRRRAHRSSSRPRRPTVLARDWLGNALGGVRSPHVDVPIATLQRHEHRAWFLPPLREHDPVHDAATRGALPDARGLRHAVVRAR